MRVSKPRVPSSSASKHTLKRRSQQSDKYMEVISGQCAEKQRAADMKRMTKQKQENFLTQAGVKTKESYITADKQLAMQMDLNLNENQMRGIRRWGKQDNIKYQSDSYVRKNKRKHIGDYLHCESKKFEFKKDKKTIVKEAPVVFVSDIQGFTLQMIQQYDKEGKLTWHGGIPEDEMWLKIGGDFGQETFKFCMQLVNLAKPNSTDNTVILTASEAPDTQYNLEKMLHRFSTPLQEMDNNLKYKDKKMRIIATSDIAFVNKNFGLPGGNPTHPCYKCEICQADMQIPHTKRKSAKKRTLKNLEENYQGYARSGFDKKRQAQFKNVINRAILLLEPDHWLVPYLHCMLGEILKFWTLTENWCLDIERKLSELIAADGGPLGKTAFEEYVKDVRKILKLKRNIDEIQGTIEQITGRIEQGNISQQKDIDDANKELRTLHTKKKSLEADVTSMESEKKLSKGDGPITSKLDDILDNHKIKREHYHGGIFNGNACDRFLKVYNSVYDDIYSTVKSLAEATGHTEILSDAFEFVIRFKTLFHLRKNVHDLISHSNPIFEYELPGIQQAIDDYLEYYRSVIGGRITVKQHLLEDHAVDCLRKCKVGFGLLGEQGFESIHRKFKEIWKNTISFNPSKRLTCALKRQHVSVIPKLISLKPDIKRRKTSK